MSTLVLRHGPSWVCLAVSTERFPLCFFFHNHLRRRSPEGMDGLAPHQVLVNVLPRGGKITHKHVFLVVLRQ
ncbi:Uncharacterized protein TCM_002193 [Theobroma cacao]|uniref:Uncharacterized protein n=1 Tax=Theobroma cacao TaxID=3641 RepID=A0A061DTP4_THECC|nr:Uncharacterized protein TCM_002193 [Theobroma cacao]